MKAFSSAVSITVHVAVGAAVLFGTTKTDRSDPGRPREVAIVIAPDNTNHDDDGAGGLPVPGPITIKSPDFTTIPGANTIPAGLVPSPRFSPLFSPAVGSGSSTSHGWAGVIEEHAEVLTGPLPVYPDLLRQAGVPGKVVLEVTVDTTGRVLAPSILVVSATNPGFVAPARAALLATLFRPAMVAGKAVRMRVRIPYEFAIRDGAGQAR